MVFVVLRIVLSIIRIRGGVRGDTTHKTHGRRKRRKQMPMTLRMRRTIPRVSVSNDLDIDILIHSRLIHGTDESFVHPSSQLAHPIIS